MASELLLAGPTARPVRARDAHRTPCARRAEAHLRTNLCPFGPRFYNSSDLICRHLAWINFSSVVSAGRALTVTGPGSSEAVACAWPVQRPGAFYTGALSVEGSAMRTSKFMGAMALVLSAIFAGFWTWQAPGWLRGPLTPAHRIHSATALR